MARIEHSARSWPGRFFRQPASRPLLAIAMIKWYHLHMNENKIRGIVGWAQGEITEKKSRFIATAFEIHSEEEALSILESVRKKYYDARHNCYAYVLGSGNKVQRFSDDKEPQGTAGKPILEVILKQGFSNTLIVVTRYFGGILLGTGGLLRAYTEAAQAALEKAQEEGKAPAIFRGTRVDVRCDYGMYGKIQYIMNQMDIPVIDTVYDTGVTCKMVVPSEKLASFQSKITEATNAASRVITGETSSYIMSGTIPVLYSL